MRKKILKILRTGNYSPLWWLITIIAVLFFCGAGSAVVIEIIIFLFGDEFKRIIFKEGIAGFLFFLALTFLWGLIIKRMMKGIRL